MPFSTIVQYLNLTSSKFVTPMFETALLNALNNNDTSSQSQHVVNCNEVQRYESLVSNYCSTIMLYHNRRDVDTSNGWTRMECTTGLTEGSEQLLTQLRSIRNSFLQELPSTSLVIAEQFNFSSNTCFDNSYHTSNSYVLL